MRLAVLIPTYDGGTFLQRAVLAHLAQLRTLRLTDVEIVISDNASGPQSREIARGLTLAHSDVRLLEQPQHLSTAEEHIFAAASQLEHEFLWTFGDDDLPAPGALAAIYDQVVQGDFDLIIGNIRAFRAGSGTYFPGANIWSGIVGTEHDLFGRVQDVVRSVGYQSVSACASALVFRREIFCSAPFDAYSRLSCIYAHVACCLDAFAGRNACFLARPVVDYRFGATPDGHWRDYARAQKAPVNRPWTFGIVDHLELLLSRGKIDADFPVRVREHHPEHTFALWAHVLHRVVEDMETGAWAALGLRQGAHELDRLSKLFGVGVDPAPLEIVERLKAVWLGMAVGRDDGAAPLLQGEEDSDASARAARLAPVREALAPALKAFPDRAPAPEYELGTWIDLSCEESGRYLRSGFSHPEPWGRWTVGSFARIAIGLRGVPPRPLLLEADVTSVFTRAGSSGDHAPELWVDDGPSLKLTDAGGGRVTFPVARSGATAAADELNVTVAVREPKRLDEAPVDDPRALGVGLARLRFVPA